MNLSPEQQNAVVAGEPVGLSVAGTECVLLRKDIYLQLSPEYDCESWTTDEMNVLADEVDALLSQKESHAT
jgi:hypothetical protein